MTLKRAFEVEYIIVVKKIGLCQGFKEERWGEENNSVGVLEKHSHKYLTFVVGNSPFSLVMGQALC